MTTKQLFRLPHLFLWVAILFIAESCSTKSPEPTNEQELITKVLVNFVPVIAGNPTVTYSYSDLDGPGGNAPQIAASGSLKANISYSVSVQFLDESKTPTKTITTEVSEEAEEHQVFFVKGGTLNVSFNYSDKDKDNRPLGLLWTATTGAASTGTLRVVLKHKLDKAATGVASGDLTNAGGDTDVDVTFNVTIAN